VIGGFVGMFSIFRSSSVILFARCGFAFAIFPELSMTWPIVTMLLAESKR